MEQGWAVDLRLTKWSWARGGACSGEEPLGNQGSRNARASGRGSGREAWLQGNRGGEGPARLRRGWERGGVTRSRDQEAGEPLGIGVWGREREEPLRRPREGEGLMEGRGGVQESEAWEGRGGA